MAGQLLNTPGLCLWAPNAGCGFLCSLWPHRYLADCWKAYGPTQGLGLAMCPPGWSGPRDLQPLTPCSAGSPKNRGRSCFHPSGDAAPTRLIIRLKSPRLQFTRNRRNRATLCSQLVPQRYQQHLLVPTAASVLPTAERGQG